MKFTAFPRPLLRPPYLLTTRLYTPTHLLSQLLLRMSHHLSASSALAHRVRLFSCPVATLSLARSAPSTWSNLALVGQSCTLRSLQRPLNPNRPRSPRRPLLKTPCLRLPLTKMPPLRMLRRRAKRAIPSRLLPNHLRLPRSLRGILKRQPLPHQRLHQPPLPHRSRPPQPIRPLCHQPHRTRGASGAPKDGPAPCAANVSIHFSHIF